MLEVLELVKDLTDPRNDEKRFPLRVNADTMEGALPYAALIPPDQERSGPYGGMSFVMFPSSEPGEPALIAIIYSAGRGRRIPRAPSGRPAGSTSLAA